MTRQDFCLFFSLALSDADWNNLDLSGVQRVMLPLSLAHARPDILARLAGMGVRLIIRLEEDYYNDEAPKRVTLQVKDAQRLVPVEAIIVGVEPDNAFNLNYGSPTWGQPHAYEHRAAAWRVFNALVAAGLGMELVSAGHTMHSISEDEVPAPGREAWAEICRPLYSQMDGAGAHIYGYGSDGHYINTVRALFALKAAQERFHKPIWIDEIAFDSGSQVERMDAVLRFARLMERHWNGKEWIPHPLSHRVRMICPFVSNGDPYKRDAQGNILRDAEGKPLTHWKPELLINNPQAYELVGRYMAGN